MEKTVKLRALSRIERNGEVFCSGTEAEVFECDLKEAKRLKGLGVAVTDVPEPVIEEPDKELDELLEKIRAAETVDELADLMPTEEPSPEVVVAFECRMAELKG